MGVQPQGEIDLPRIGVESFYRMLADRDVRIEQRDMALRAMADKEQGQMAALQELAGRLQEREQECAELREQISALQTIISDWRSHQAGRAEAGAVEPEQTEGVTPEGLEAEPVDNAAEPESRPKSRRSRAARDE